MTDYKIRMSRRAQRARIVVHTDGTVEVVVPFGLDALFVPRWVASQRPWIDKARARIQRRKSKAGEGPERLPETICLPMLGEELRVHYRSSELPSVRCKVKDDGLHVSGPVDDVIAVREALQAWLKKQARTCLPDRLQYLADTHGFRVGDVSIRLQKSRWGSCSARGSISLNAKLLLLPAALVDHVLLHELAHIRHMNHSAAFWTLLGKLDSQCAQHRKQLRHAMHSLPAWVQR